MHFTRVIIFSGGGSSGHVMPSLAIAGALPQWTPVFLCSTRADECEAVTAAGYSCIAIHAGKFPRGMSLRIVTFPVLFLVSLLESLFSLIKCKPVLIMSKGGFVSVPVCIAGFFLRIPIVLHASDSVPSASDRIIGRLAKRICTGFPVSAFPGTIRSKAIQTGNPVRASIRDGSPAAGRRITGFSGRRPIVMIIGGSQGSVALNEAVKHHFEKLLDQADLIHLTGEGKSIHRQHARYFARPTILEELPHLYRCADLIVTRAGAGVLSELAALQKPAIVVPLPGVAHDHQIRNAEFLSARHAIEFLAQNRLDELPTVVSTLLADAPRRLRMGKALGEALPANATERIAEIIVDAVTVNG